ncbi:MAG: energy transducer TonB [Alphaproteobacteria bacterium]|nr:energy transducer TonB [Alphaproteobacteria bacterium]MCB9693546.1 energy transducer TonB [Alphaproteobacteria bacterium]
MLATLALVASAAPAPEGSPYVDVPFLHHSGLTLRKRVEPVYPEVDEADRRVRHRCVVWVRVGPEGTPEDARVLPDFPGDGCSAPFQAAAQASVASWSWKPEKIGKDKATVQTQIAVVFDAQPMPPVVDVSLAGSPPPEPVPQPKKSIYGDPKTLPAPAPEPEE